MNKRINESKRFFTIDYFLAGIIILSAITGIVGIYLAIPMNGAAEGYDKIIRQLSWFIISAIVIYTLIKIGIDRIFSMSYIIYWILLGMLFIQVLARFRVIRTGLIPQINGAYAWFVFPGIGSFQTSEFMKIVLIFIAANIITEHNENKHGNSFGEDFALAFKIASYALPALILIILQPDTGIPIVILVSLAIMFFMSGVRREWFLIIGAVVVIAFATIIYLYYNDQPLLNKLFGGSAQNYRLNRFYGWLDYEKYAGDQGHHLYNSISSIGTAGWTGHDLRSIVLRYPESETDFIFAVLAQNFGFIGSALIILLVFSLDFRLTWIAFRSNLPRERALLTGAIGMLLFQHFQNISMVIGIMPITGITLPFISYGGSSTLSYMIPLAVAFTMHSETKNAHRH